MNFKVATLAGAVAMAIATGTHANDLNKVDSVPSYQKYSPWYTEGQANIKAKPFAALSKSRNVILFVGDGMGFPLSLLPVFSKAN